MTHDTTMVGDQGDGPAPPRVEVDGQRFRVWTPRVTTQWLPDTPGHRHTTVGWWRLLVEAHGTPLCTLQAWAVMVGRAHRQAARQPREDCRQCGDDGRAWVLRQRKGDAPVVEAVWAELLHTPLAGPTALVSRVHAPLGRQDLTAAPVESALAQSSCVPGLRTRRRQWAAGHVPSQAAARVTERLESLALPGPLPAGESVPPADRGRRLADPTALAALVTPDLPLAQGPGSLCGLPFRMTRGYWHVPLSVLGRWCGVHTTTILRWVLGLALAWWPLMPQWRVEGVNAHRVDVDEQWRKIRGRWQSGVVVLAVAPALPVLAAWLPSRSPWACRGLGRQLRRLKNVPQVIIPDGLHAYASRVPGAPHVWCRVQPPQGVTHWWQRHVATEAESTARQPVMTQVLQTRAQRPVRRRRARLKERAAALGMTPWVAGVEEKLPQLIWRAGSVRVPSTTKAIEPFFRAFQRFYRPRGGFHAVLSAQRDRLLFWVVSVFTQHATTGHAPIETILPAARRMPLARVLNDPFRALQARVHVTGKPEMADRLLPKAAAA